MSNISEDALFEALTIDRLYLPASRPHYYHNGSLWSDWWGSVKGVADVAYFKICDADVPVSSRNMHRLFGPAYISRKYNIEAWYKDGEFHRVGGPAYRHKNNQVWMVDGKLHRLDGPAVDIKGHPKEYWINGQKLSPKEYKKEIERRHRKGLINE